MLELEPRYANLLAQTNLRENMIWKIVKQIRFQTSLDYSCGNKVLFECDGIMPQMELFEQSFELKNTSEQILQNMTTDKLKLSAEIFIYLNFCPGRKKNWFTFYKDLFETKSAGQIMLTLNRIRNGRTTPKNDFFKILSKTLLQRTGILLSLMHEQIENMLPGPDVKIDANPEIEPKMNIRREGK